MGGGDVPNGSVRGRGGAESGRRRQFRAGQVVLAAGAFGTQRLLQAMALAGTLPELSPKLGQLTRTNSESLLAAVVPHDAPRPDFSRGVAITSSFYPQPGTHVEPVRYGHGSNMMGLFGTMMVEGGDGANGSGPSGGGPNGSGPDGSGSDGSGPDGSGPNGSGPDGSGPNWRRFISAAARDPGALMRAFDLRAWSERTVIALVMQAHDNSLTISGKRDRFGRTRLVSRQGHGQPNPTWLPVGHEVVRAVGRSRRG